MYALMPACFMLCLLVRPGIGTRVDFLDVGQGDGIFINDASDHSLMIDGGSTSEKRVGEYVILPFLKYNGVRDIDYWILTHADEDHISGLKDVIEDGYRIQNILISKASKDDEGFSELIRQSKECGINIVYVQAGDSLALDGGKMICLSPKATYKTDDRNELSQVWGWFGDDGMDYLFTGDVGADTEKTLIKEYKLDGIDILTVAHHGSKYSSPDEYIEEISPKISIISCAQKNKYGHPHKETLDRLEQAGSYVLKTFEEGQISIIKRRGRWRVTRKRADNSFG